MHHIFDGAFAVTPHDTNANAASALYIGVAGDVAVVTRDRATSVVFKAVPVGVLPVRVSQVLATGTTATDIVGLV